MSATVIDVLYIYCVNGICRDFNLGQQLAQVYVPSMEDAAGKT